MAWSIAGLLWSIAGLLASGSDDGLVKIWNPSTGEEEEECVVYWYSI